MLFRSKVWSLLENRKKLLSALSNTQEINILPTNQHDELINKITEYIDANFSKTELDINQIVNDVGINRVQLWKKFKSTTGKNITDYILEVRMKHAKKLLTSGNYRISEIAYDIGFSSPSYFTKCFTNFYGISPKDFLKKQGSNNL